MRGGKRKREMTEQQEENGPECVNACVREREDSEGLLSLQVSAIGHRNHCSSRRPMGSGL